MAKPKKRSQAAPGKSKLRSATQYFAQPRRRQEAQLKAARVITAMRTEAVSLTRAAREENVSPGTVRRNAGSALRKTPRGTYKARASDRMLRVLVIPTSEGLAEIATRDSRSATIVGEHWNAVNHYLESGDDSQLARLRDVTVIDAEGNAVPLLTDTEELDRLASVGMLSFQSLYARAS